MAIEKPTTEVLQAARRIRLRTRRLVSDLLAGSFRSMFPGAGIEFHEVREYTVDDEARSIDWNVTARSGRPHVKTFVEEREQRFLLLVDGSASMDFTSGERTKREVSTDVAAILAFAAIENGDRVGLALASRGIEMFVAPRKGIDHGMRLLRELVGFRPEGAGVGLAPAIEDLTRLARRRAVIFVLSDFFDDGWEGPLRRLASRHRVVAIRLVDPLETALEGGSILVWRDLESGRIREVDQASTKVREGFRRRVREHEARVREGVYHAPADLIEVGTRGSPARPLVEFFESRVRRRS